MSDLVSIKVQSPMAKTIVDIEKRLAKALRRYGNAVNATAVLNGIKSVSTMQKCVDCVERNGGHDIFGFDLWCRITTKAVIGRDLAERELKKWEIHNS